MSLFEKSIQSFMTNVNLSHYSGGPQPLLCIADTLPFPSYPIQHTILHKLTHNDNCTPNIISISNALNPLFSQSHPSITRLFPSTTSLEQTSQLRSTTSITTTTDDSSTTSPSTNSTTTKPLRPYQKTSPWTLTTLLDTVHTTIQSLLSTPTTQQQPIVIFISITSLPTILSPYDPSQITTLLQQLLHLPIAGIIYTVATDSITLSPSPSSTTIFNAQPSTHLIDIFDQITSKATTLIQTLPPSSTQPQAILSCRVSHRDSTGKVTSDTIQLEQHSSKPIIISLTQNITNQNQFNTNYNALPTGLQDLPFNLTLTAHQMQQRSQVELPYAHQGQLSQHNNQQQQIHSNSHKLGMLSSAPVKKSKLFDEIIDDDDQDEDSEL